MKKTSTIPWILFFLSFFLSFSVQGAKPKDTASVNPYNSSYSTSHKNSVALILGAPYAVPGFSMEIRYGYDLWRDRLRLVPAIGYDFTSKKDKDLNSIDYGRPSFNSTFIYLSCMVEIDAVRAKFFSWTFALGVTAFYQNMMIAEKESSSSGFFGGGAFRTSFRFAIPKSPVTFELCPFDFKIGAGNNVDYPVLGNWKCSLGVSIKL
ncbi:MAG: hypothetical protein RRX93_00450 [Bacteroidales bacterium]